MKKKLDIRIWKGKEVIVYKETEHYALVSWNIPNPYRKLFSVKNGEIELKSKQIV
jgi:hypothetical protein